MSQSQITSTLILNYFKSRGMDTSKDQSQNPEFMRTYREIAESIRKWHDGEDRDEARRELEEMRLAFKERDSLRKHSADLARISVTEKGQIRSAGARVKSATIAARARVETSRARGFDAAVSKLEAELSTTIATKGAADRLATAIAGSLTAEGEYGGIPSSAYTKVLDWAAEQNIDFRNPKVLESLKDNQATYQSMKLFVQRAKTADDAQRNLVAQLDAEDATQAKLLAALDKAKQSDVDTVADLQRQLQLSTAKSAELVEGMDMGTDKATVSARIAKIDKENETLKILEARLAKMDAQLSAGTGPASEDAIIRGRIADVIGRDNFRQWAKDNGYTEDDIGYVRYDENNRAIISTFAPGAKTIRAMNQFEHQSTNPNRHSRLLGPSSRTNEIHVFDMVVDPATVERFKHSDGKWVISTDEDGIERYVTEGESRDYLSRYVRPTVKVGVGDDGKAYLKAGSEANPVYYEVDGETGKPINGAYYERAEGPKTWVPKAGDLGLVLRDAEGNATRYLQAEDLADVGAVDFSTATDEDRQALNSEYGDLKISVVDSPPAAATRTVTARRLKTDAMDVYHGQGGQNHRSYIDVSTNLEFRIDPTEIKNLKSYQTKSDTNFKDFANFLGSRRQTRIAEKAQDTSEIEYEEKMVNGVMTREYGSTKLNVFDKLQGKITGPDLKPDRAEASAITQERAAEAAQEDRQLAQDALDIARQDREAATKRFNEAAEDSQERKDAYAEMVAAQKVVRKSGEALSKIERKLARKADPAARVTGAELTDDGDVTDAAELVDAPTTTTTKPAPGEEEVDTDEPRSRTDIVTGEDVDVTSIAERGAVLAEASDLAEDLSLSRISADPTAYLRRLNRAYELSDNDPKYLPLIALAQTEAGYLDRAQKTLDKYTQTEGVDIGPDSMAIWVTEYLGSTKQERALAREDFDARMADREFKVTPMADEYSSVLADIPDIVASGDPTQAFADAQLRREGEHPDQIVARQQAEAAAALAEANRIEAERAAAERVEAEQQEAIAGLEGVEEPPLDPKTQAQGVQARAAATLRRLLGKRQRASAETAPTQEEADAVLSDAERDRATAERIRQQRETDTAIAQESEEDTGIAATNEQARLAAEARERLDQADALESTLEGQAAIAEAERTPTNLEGRADETVRLAQEQATGDQTVAGLLATPATPTELEIEQKRAVAAEKRKEEEEDKRKKDTQIAQQAAAGEGIDATGVTPPTETQTVEGTNDEDDAFNIQFQSTGPEVIDPQGGPSLKPEAAKGPTGAQDKQRAQILAALQGRESAESKKRQESDKGQPSPASPTETAKAGPDTMVPSLSDKDKAEAKSLVEKMRQIQDVIYEMDQSGVA